MNSHPSHPPLGGEYKIPADLHLVVPSISHMELICVKAGMAADVWANVKMAIAEGLSNAIEHGCRCDSDDKVLLRWKWENEQLMIEIRDTSSFLPNTDEAPLPEDLMCEGGRGRYLMATLMDTVQHYLEGRYHVLRLIKHVGPPKST